MDEQNQVVHQRRQRSRAEAGQLVAAYEASGLSRAEFCSSLGLGLSTLTRYQRWQRAAESKTLANNRWVSVELSGAGPGPAVWAGSGLAISLPARRRIEVGQGFDAQTLVELMGVLDGF